MIIFRFGTRSVGHCQRWRALGLCVLATLCWLWTPGWLRADTTSLSGATEITSLPCNISESGVYYLSQNFLLNLTNANAITVSADHVTIDFNGHTISDVAAGAGVSASGVYAHNAACLTVRNGVIRGFTYGVFADSSTDYGDLIENMRFTDATYAAIGNFSAEMLVRHCQVYRVGGSTLPQFPNGVGILIFGTNSTVQDCDVSDMVTLTAYSTIGIYINGCSGVLVVGNRIGNAQLGICFDSQGSGAFRDNLCAASVGTPYTGGNNAGNN